MKRAIVTNRIFLEKVSPELEKILKKKLTYRIPIIFSGKDHMGYLSKGLNSVGLDIIKHYKKFPNNIISIPQTRLDLVPDEYEVLDYRVKVPVDYPEPKFNLFASQKEVYDQVTDNCTIKANPGWGKTFTSLHILKKLGQKALIIVPNTFLKKQWQEEVEKLFGIKAGVISGKIEDLDSPVVISNIQAMNLKVDKYTKEFGIIFVDEYHHSSSDTYKSVLDKMWARYKIGVSATITREDNKHIFLEDFYSKQHYVGQDSNTLIPIVHNIKTNIQIPNNNVTWASKMSILYESEEYKMLVEKLTKHYLAEGHKVLVVGDRISFLEDIFNRIGDESILITGSIGDRDIMQEQIISNQKNCIIASKIIFAEGLSINPLSCLILATPLKSLTLLEQLCGRVTRKYKNKKQPIIVDINLGGGTGYNQSKIRNSFYKEKDWKNFYKNDTIF